MSATNTREQATRISDLENALKAIGRIVADPATTPKARLQRVAGVLSMYGCEAQAIAKAEGVR